MPKYVFENGGCVIRRLYDEGECPKTIAAFGHVWTLLDMDHPKVNRKLAKWPMLSEAAAVNPRQVEEMRAQIKTRGLPGVDVIPDGRIQLDTPRARRAFNRSFGYHDNHGYD